MPGNRMVTLATFSNPIEAELAKNWLEAEGIQTFLSGEAASNLFGGTFGVTIALQVGEADAERADRVLADLPKPGDLRRNFLADAARAIGVEENEDNTAIKTPEWASPDESDEDDPEAQYRAADTEVQRAKPANDERIMAGASEAAPARREEAIAPQEADEEEDLHPTWKPDDYASRALKAAIIGLIVLPGILHLYSVYLLIRLMLMDEDLSPAGTRKLYGALVINGIVLVALVLLYLSLWG